MKFRNYDRTAWKYFIFPALCLVLIVGIAPLLYSLFISTYQYNIAKTVIPFKFIGFQNYITLLTSNLFWNSFKLTSIFVIITVLVELSIGTTIALLLFRNIKGRNIFRSLFLIPMVIPSLAVGLIGRFVFSDSIGIVNTIMRILNLPTIVWYGNTNFALMTMILLDIWQWTPFMMIIILAGMMSIPDEYYEAARIEGVNYFGEIFKIMIPTLRNVYSLAILIRVIDAFKEFDKIYIMTKGGPSFATNLLTIHNYTIAFKEFNIGLGSALSIMILIIMIFLGTFLVRRLRRD